MSGRSNRGLGVGAGFALALLTIACEALGGPASGTSPVVPPSTAGRRAAPSVDAVGRPASRAGPLSRRYLAAPPDAGSARKPRAYLIYLLDGGEPIVVERYVEENGQILFQKYGGWVRIPTYEILQIVPDEPDRTVNLPARALLSTGGAPLLAEPDLYLTMRGGGNLKVAALTTEGDRVRVAVPNGSFTVPRSEILGVVRVPPGADVPEAWLSIRTTETTGNGTASPESAGLVPTPPEPRLPYQKSDHPHLLRLANGQLMRVEAFWIEDGEFRFRRLGGVVGIALGEVLRLIPEEIAAVRGRTPVRFARRLGPDLLAVSIRSGYHHVRLVGVEPVNGTWTAENPWRQLERGMIVHLEFDRQRYDAEGNWLAYVFLPNGRMLNAELIRLGMARPRPDGRNVRYLDLLHEVATGEIPEAAAEEPADLE